MTEVTLFSKPACRQCTMTAREFDKLGIKYREVNMMEDETALTEVKSLGYLAAPVVYVSEEVHWSGFRPDLIAEHL